MPRSSNVRRERPRLLIVEDHQAIRELVTTLFHRSGWEVVQARDLNEAYGALATRYGAYDAAIVDLMLPDCDQSSDPPASAATLIRDMRRLEAGSPRPTRIVVCTACDHGDKLVKQAIAAGADACHFKPIEWLTIRPDDPSLLLGGQFRAGLRDVVAGLYPGDVDIPKLLAEIRKASTIIRNDDNP